MNDETHNANAADKDRALREHLLYLLRGGGAHADFEAVVADFPEDFINRRAAGVPYTPWQLLEHMRIAQHDIIEFSRDPAHVSPDFPEGYWPAPDARADRVAWNRSVESFRANLKQMTDLVENPSTDLYARIPHGEGQTILREALLVADHNAYHVGALVVIKRTLEATCGAGDKS